ncbi:MAG: pilus assembly protein TadG-related protein [Candidatus Sericytochromatia bacterium]|nr:pilus assembly protein TadG-related protein [Candidatus Sericytochromatia bacterium]
MTRGRTVWRRLAAEEEGQALVWGAGVVVLTMALFYGAIDIGLLVLGKIQAQTAADASALAATGLKAGVHNTRSLAYRASSGQIALARAHLVRATGLALNGLVDPGGGNRKAFRDALGRAIHHRENVEALHLGIVGFNAWVARAEVGPAGVKKAAEAAYRGNMGVLGTMDATNMALIRRSDALAEFASGGLIGGTAFQEEAVGSGSGGKSHVRVEPKVTALGSGLLGYGRQSLLAAAATAGPVNAAKTYGRSLAALDPKKGYGVNWYTVRLLKIGNRGERE